MKNQILTFLLGIFVTISIAAGTVASNPEILTFKPAKPISTVSYTGEQPSVFSQYWAARGYIVVTSASQGYYNTFVVMCKY
jgi:hypothetical protein